MLDIEPFKNEISEINQLIKDELTLNLMILFQLKINV